jgi:predicted outer membrane repeat protein
MHSVTGFPGTRDRTFHPLPFRTLLCVLIILMLALAAPVSGFHVPFHFLNPGDSIQQNITTAFEGDTLILNPGTYNEHGITISKSIAIRANETALGTAANTIIDGHVAGRIFDNTGGYTLSLDNLTLRNGYISGNGGAITTTGGTVNVTSVTFTNSSATGFGGAIYGNGGTVNVTRSSFSDCSAYYGGGIRVDSGTVNVTRSSFTRCSAVRGGAIFSDTSTVNVPSTTFSECSATDFGGAIYDLSGTVTVPSSTFLGCSASSGGAIQTSGTTFSVISSTFSNCSPATSYGAINAESSTGTIHFSRFCNGLTRVISEDGGSVDAAHNWWGGAYDDPGYYVDGNVIYNPWLVLGITAKPSSIGSSSTSVVRVNMTYDSDGSDVHLLGHVPDGTPVPFRIVSGTGSLSPEGGTLAAGANKTTFTPAGAGTSIVSVSLDNADVSASIKVKAPPTITSITPNSGPKKGNTPITIRGTNFISGGHFGVTVGGAAATSVVRVNATAITAKTPPGTPGVKPVVVTNNDGQTATKPGGFTYIAPPTIKSITPGSGPAAGNTLIMIRGSNFVAGGLFGVKVGGAAATSVIRVNATAITARTPAGTPGAKNVVVTNKDGQTATKPGGFTYV